MFSTTTIIANHSFSLDCDTLRANHSLYVDRDTYIMSLMSGDTYIMCQMNCDFSGEVNLKQCDINGNIVNMYYIFSSLNNCIISSVTLFTNSA